jgi:hypothetical protein
MIPGKEPGSDSFSISGAGFNTLNLVQKHKRQACPIFGTQRFCLFFPAQKVQCHTVAEQRD